MKSIRKLTLLAVILCCGAWVAAQSSPSGGSTAPSGSSGTAGPSSTPGSTTGKHRHTAGRHNSDDSRFDIPKWDLSECNYPGLQFPQRDA